MKSSEIWNELGNTYFKAGVLDKAIDAYCKAIEQMSESGWSYNNLAVIYVQQGRFLEAIPLYQKSLELFTCHKDQAAIWVRLGSVHHHLNEYGKAIQAYQKADEIMQMWNSAKSTKSFSQEKAEGKSRSDISARNISKPTQQSWHEEFDQVDPFGEHEETLLEARDNREPRSEIFEDVLNKGERGIEENANIWNELGLILFKVGAYDDAIDAYKKAIELEPSFGYLYSNLGQVYVSQGRLTEAIDLYEKSIKLLFNNKDKATSWTRLGDIYRQLSQYDEAMAAYQLADVLNQTLAATSDDFRKLNVDLIMTNSGPTREMEDINDLVVSVRVHGIIQPLIVCPGRIDSGKYLLIAGRRRLEAARRVGLKEVPVIIRQANEREILELSINENIHSAAIDPFVLANGYRELADEFDLSMEEISERVGRSCHSVANTMKVLDHSEGVKVSVPHNDQLREDARPAPNTVKTPSESSNAQNTSTALNSEYPEIHNGNEPDQMKIGGNSDEDTSPTLWYLEKENDDVVAQSREEYFPETTTLLARARHALKCNPHARRFGVAPFYRA
jgi:ParB/RepB/Spo0J family partition protein